MINLRQTLREIPALADLDHDDLVALDQAMIIKRFEDGDVLIREGQSADSLLIIVDGKVSISTKERGGIGFKVDKSMGPGEIIGLIGLVDQKKRSATCVAEGPVTAAVLPRTAFTMLYNSYAKLAYGFQRLVANQLAQDSRRLNELLHNALEDLA